MYVQVRPPMPFVHFFLIDASYNAVTSGALQAACSAIARILEELQGEPLQPAALCLVVMNSLTHMYSHYTTWDQISTVVKASFVKLPSA